MKKIIAFAGSNSQNSINRKLVTFATGLLSDTQVEMLDLNDYEMPIYSIDREQAGGIPALASEFKSKIQSSDGIAISFAEHNGAYTVAFKNVMDWMSRLEGSVWDDKPMLLLSTSPGGRGGKSVLDLATNSFAHMNKNTITSFSLPSFQKNFEEGTGITDPELAERLKDQVVAFEQTL